MAVSPQFSLRALLLCIAVIAAAIGLLVLPLQRHARFERTKQSLKAVCVAYLHSQDAIGSPPSRVQDLNRCPKASSDASALEHTARPVVAGIPS